MKSAFHHVGYTASVLFPIFFAALLFAATPESTRNDPFLSLFKIIWFTSLVFVLSNLIGILYGSPWHQERRAERDWLGWDQTKRLIVTYVSRGDNAEALRRAITASKLVLEDMGIQYWIEAVTDMPVKVGADTHIVVPKGYRAPNGAKYKARALHYASQIRAPHRYDWILHLDEESVITPQAVRGIAKFIEQAPRNLKVIGQGEIKYNAYNYGRNPLITAVDAIRTGDDLGRFRLQYRLFKRPLFGMHGSFFVVNALLERAVGFDLGTKGSITEDAYFALVCAAKGVRFDWIEGFICEQSPFTLLALLKQRRRWITGLRLLMWDRTIQLRQRLLLIVSISLSHISWLSLVVTVWNILAGGSLLPFWLAYGAALMSGVIYAMYLLGAYRNVTDSDLPAWRQLYLWLLSGVLVPVSCAVEGLAVLYSIVAPVRVFEVVDKN